MKHLPRKKREQAKRRTNPSIINYDGDGFYYFNQMFPAYCLGESQAQNDITEIKYSFYEDIERKYNLPPKTAGKFLRPYSLEIIRSLAIFGEHQHLIDMIRLKLDGSF